jgi:hypothetical protein
VNPWHLWLQTLETYLLAHREVVELDNLLDVGIRNLLPVERPEWCTQESFLVGMLP